MTVDKLRSFEPLFGSWTVESKLAEGRHSKIFKVSNTNDGQAEYKCLKTIKFPSGDEELSKVISSELYENVQQYLDEVELSVRSNMDRMLSLNENEHIVRFDSYTIIKESSCFYLVILMELLKPLNECLEADNVTQNDVIDLGCDICLALEGFREAGIIHREVKPENIYVDENGIYKLGDFGVCRGRFGEDTAVSSYIAPELYTNGEADINSDLYSLGILLYKLLNNNRLPFLPSFPAPVSIEDRESAFTKRMRGDLFPAPSNATSQLANVLYKATAFNVNERFTEPEALFIALENQYITPEQESRTEIFTPPVVPVNPYHITDETGVPLYEQSPVLHSDVTEEEKEDFAEIFSDDDEEEDESEGEKVDKKWYFIIIGLVAVLVIIIGFIAKGTMKDKDVTTTTAAPEVTFGQQTLAPTTTTEPTTTETTTQTTTTETTTSATTTTETTTKATTTTQTTTSATTTTETTTSATTTEATTTTETTTTATTTETTTTTATTTESTTEGTTQASTESTTVSTTGASTEPTSAEYVEPVLVYSPNVEGGTDTRGRVYKEVKLNVESGFSDGNNVVLAVTGLEGADAESNESFVTVCAMDNTRMVKRSSAVVFIETEGEDIITFRVTADDESFTFEPDKYQYFICFEDGALGTKDSANLGTQIRITE